MKARAYLKDEKVWVTVLEIDFKNQFITIPTEEVWRILGLEDKRFYSGAEWEAVEAFQKKYSGPCRTTAGELIYLQLLKLGETLIIEEGEYNGP